ncbi:MAG: OmpA family protein [Candidatus Muiribacteriota bacterium]
MKKIIIILLIYSFILTYSESNLKLTLEIIKGSENIYSEFVNFDNYTIPLGPVVNNNFSEIKHIEGSVTRNMYIKKEYEPQDIFDEYIQWFEDNDYQILWKAIGEEGGSRFNIHAYDINPVDYDRNYGRSAPFISGSSSEQYYIAAFKKSNDKEIHVTVNINRGWWNYPVYRIDIIESDGRLPEVVEAMVEQTVLPVGIIKNSRFEYQETVNLDRYKIPLAPVTEKEFRVVKEIEGSIVRTIYTVDNQSAFGIYQTFLNHLEKSEFEFLWKMEREEGGSNFKKLIYSLNPVDQDRNYSRSIPFGSGSDTNQYYIAAKKTGSEKNIYVTININHGYHNTAYYRIDIIETDGKLPEVITADEIAQSITEKGRVEIYGILFDTASANLRDESKKAIEIIANYILSNSQKEYFIVGHTDSAGSFDMNLNLSRERALSVLNYLKENYSVNDIKLTAYGAGPLYPVLSNETESGRMYNRRVELVVK